MFDMDSDAAFALGRTHPLAHRVGDALDLVAEELVRATLEFGPFASPHEGYAILEEELDELWEEIKANRGRSPEARAEAMQVAAMAVRYMIDIPLDAQS